MSDFRTELVALLDAAEIHCCAKEDHWGEWYTARALARAALAAAPAPVVGAPTDEELEDFAWKHGGGYFNCDCQEEADILTRKHVRFARAVITRYGTTPAPVPVPVAERPLLKRDPFNDDQGRCWCGTRAFVDEHGDRPVDYPPSWELREPCAQDDCVLPHDALPLPEVAP